MASVFILKFHLQKIIKVITLAQEIEDVKKTAGWLENSMQAVLSHLVIFAENQFIFFYFLILYDINLEKIVLYRK